MFAAILFSALVAGTVSAPVGNNSTVLAPPGDMEGILDYLMHQNFGAEGGQPHLYFYFINKVTTDCTKGFCRCGDIDAAQRMPADLFKPENILSLAQYTSLTLKLYTSLGMNGQTLKLGRCKDKTNFTEGPAGVQGINWVNSVLMQPICLKQCKCNYPACRDEPDDPKAGKWCSLCGPKFNDYITIKLWYIPDGSESSAAVADSEQLTVGEFFPKEAKQIVA